MEEKKSKGGGGGGSCPASASFGSLTVSPWSSTPYSDAVNRKRRRPEGDDAGPDSPAKAGAAATAAAGRIKRPMNAFMVWSQTERRRLSADNPGLHNVEISRRLGQKWLQMTEEERLPFMEEAERLRLLHLRQYPEYRYVPRKKGSARNTTGKAEERRKTPVTGEAEGGAGGGIIVAPHHHHHHRRLQSTFGEGGEWTAVNGRSPLDGRFYPSADRGHASNRGDSLWPTNDRGRSVSASESTHKSSDIIPFVFYPPPPPPPPPKSHGISLPPQWSTDERVSGDRVPPPPFSLAAEVVWSAGHRSSHSVDPVLHRTNEPAFWSRPILFGDHFVTDAPYQHFWAQYPPPTSCHPSSSAAADAQGDDWLSPATPPPPPPSLDCYLPCSSVAQGTLLAADAVGFLAHLSGDFDDPKKEEEDDYEDGASLHSSSSDPFVSWLVDYYDVKRIESSA